jgi:hypothetical protein
MESIALGVIFWLYHLSGGIRAIPVLSGGFHIVNWMSRWVIALGYEIAGIKWVGSVKMLGAVKGWPGMGGNTILTTFCTEGKGQEVLA